MALILVTGASTGLGLASADALSAQGHDVVLHARNVERMRGQAVLEQMYDVAYGDLSRLDATIGVAQRARKIGTFDAVIHNAGVQHGPEVVAVNAVAPYVLTALMLPRRAIYLSSSMHFSGSTNLTSGSLTDLGGRSRTYDDSKLYVTALAMLMAGLRPDMLSHAVDPGWVPTRMGGAGAPDSLAAGHDTQEWLATADQDEITPRTGGYWYHRTARNPHPAARDPQFQRDLVSALESATGIIVPPSEPTT